MKLRSVASLLLSTACVLAAASSRADTLSGVLAVFGPAGSPPTTWTIDVTNNGPTTAHDAEIVSATLTQTAGVACTPVFLAPVLLGDIAPGATAESGNILFGAFGDFPGCAGNAAFTMDFEFSADGGAETGSLILHDIAVDQPMGIYPPPTIPVPEPSSLVLLGAALLGLLGVARRTRYEARAVAAGAMLAFR